MINDLLSEHCSYCRQMPQVAILFIFIFILCRPTKTHAQRNSPTRQHGTTFGAHGCPLGLPTHQMGTHGHQMQGPAR